MRVLLDTNVLTRSIHNQDHQKRIATHAVKALLRQGDELLTVPQVIFEFWVSCTRPKSANGLGLGIQQVRRRADQMISVFKCLPDPINLVNYWLELVTVNRVKGKNAHDARLVAAMELHHITHLLTFNTQDFQRYPNIQVISPIDLFVI